MTAALVVYEHLRELDQSLQKHHCGGRHSEPQRDRLDLPLGDITHLLSRVGSCVHPRPAGKSWPIRDSVVAVPTLGKYPAPPKDRGNVSSDRCPAAPSLAPGLTSQSGASGTSKHQAFRWLLGQN